MKAVNGTCDIVPFGGGISELPVDGCARLVLGVSSEMVGALVAGGSDPSAEDDVMCVSSL
jgi:hypothetical protein